VKGLPSVSEALHLQARHSNIVLDFAAKSVVGPERRYPNTKGLTECDQSVLKLLHAEKNTSEADQADRNVGMVTSKGVPRDAGSVLKTQKSLLIALFNVTGIRLALGVLAVNNGHVMHGRCYKGMNLAVSSRM